MEAIMDAHGLWEAIEPPTGVVVDAKKSKQARAFIFQSIPDEVLAQAAKKKTAKEVWDSLKSRYVGAERVQKARLRILKSEFEGLQMKDSDTIDEYAGRLSGMVSKYNSVGAKLEDEELVRKLFDTVPERFINLVASIEQSSDVDTMPFEEAIAHLKAYEDRVKLRKSQQTAENSLLFTKSEVKSNSKGQGKGQHVTNQKSGVYGKTDRGGRSGFRGRGRGRSNRGGHAGNQDQRNGSRNKDKRHIECFNCHEYGHYASECKEPKEKRDEANLTETKEEEPALYLCIHGEDTPSMVLLNEDRVFPKAGDNKDVWYVDNGASNHMTGMRESFAELDSSITGQVRFGDGSKVQIEGKGPLVFESRTGEHILIPDVYYIPALTSNILSLGQLTEEGYGVHMRGNTLKLYDEHEKLIMKINRSVNRLYRISLKVTKPICLGAHMDEEAWLWHTRMGHVNFNVLEYMARKDIVIGMPCINNPKQMCEGCMVAKQTRKPVPKESQWRATKPLELVHADLCGPITPQTYGGNRYFLLIVDDFTRFMWVYLLKTKDEAFIMFKKFKAEAEQNNPYQVKMLRTDRGGEFNSLQFNDFCQRMKIRRQLTAPYTPHQNGVVERRNRTVVEMTRSLLKTMSVPDQMWGEAVRHSVYLLNRILTKSVKAATPYEVLKKRKPILTDVKVFGCVAYVKDLSKTATKLSDRGTPMVYLGTVEETKGFRLLNPNTMNVVIASPSVVEVDEYRKWAWKGNNNNKESITPWWASIMVDGPEPTSQVETQESQTQIENEFTDENTPTHNPNSHSHQFESPGIQGDASQFLSRSQSSNPDVPNQSIPYDDTPPQGFRSIGEVYQKSNAMTEDQVRDLYDKEVGLLLIDGEPASFDEAATEEPWLNAMKEELASIKRNNTWTLAHLPTGHKAIGLRWVFKLKKDAQGNVIKHKARLVAKGYVQQKGIDFEDAFAPVARLETIRLLLAIAVKGGWLVHHLDVKSAFLNGELRETVYVKQPIGFEIKGKEGMVYRLHKALYGLRQAPRAWNARLDKALKDLGFSRCTHEQAVYKVHKQDYVIIVGVYVDDLIVTGSSEVKIWEFKRRMKSIFDMSDLGKLTYYLGIEVEQTKDGIILKQEGYAGKILKMAGMSTCNATNCPMQHKLKLTKDESGKEVDPTKYRRIIGCLRYLLHTRPDLSYSIGVVSRYMQLPKESHFAAVKQILRYIRGTISHGLRYKRGGNGKLKGYSDSSFGIEDGRGTTGMAFYFSDNLVTWSSQKQNTVALSSCEAEFMAATAAACQGLWLRNLVSDLVGTEAQKVKLFVDNESAIALMKNPVFHGRSKHIDTKYHFIRECVEREQIEVEHISGDLQKADILTKALPRVKFEEMKQLMGVEDQKKEVNIQGENITFGYSVSCSFLFLFTVLPDPILQHVLLSRLGLGRNPNVWKDPMRFDPDRHLGWEGKQVVLTDNELRMLSFSTGKRGCPGVILGSTITIMLLARMIQGFAWEKPYNESEIKLVENHHDLHMAKSLVALAKPRLPWYLYPKI
ncbi:putative RNA-directed DNA polymerase [Helianthus annuus]|nr:putative RNA-directed DNA polymerase [Helianthus annuus]